MKHKSIYLTFILGVCIFTLSSCIWDSGKEKGKGVYICTGPSSRRYHKHPDCRGLERCSGDIRHITLEKAKEMHRTPCGYCY